MSQSYTHTAEMEEAALVAADLLVQMWAGLPQLEREDDSWERF